MPITLECQDSRSLIRLEGDLDFSSATELKGLLLTSLASGKDLVLDLERVGAIDMSILQLLWATGREGARTGIRIVSHVSERAATVAREAGFEIFPGTVRN